MNATAEQSLLAFTATLPVLVARSTLRRTAVARECRREIEMLRRIYEAFGHVGDSAPELLARMEAAAGKHDAVRPWFMRRARRYREAVEELAP